jgi:hypothetical protein
LMQVLRESPANRRVAIYGLTSETASMARGVRSGGGLAGMIDRFDRAAIHAAVTAALVVTVIGAAAA